MLAAQFKAGKTTLIGNLVRTLADGDDWLGRDAVDPVDGSVVLLDFEMSPTQLDSWLRRSGFDTTTGSACCRSVAVRAASTS